MDEKIYISDIFLLVIFCTYERDVETIYDSFKEFTVDELKIYINAMLDSSDTERDYNDWDRVDIYTGTNEDLENISKHTNQDFIRVLANSFTVKRALALAATAMLCSNGYDAIIIYRDLKSYFVDNLPEIGKCF